MGRHSNPARPGQPQGKPPPALLPLPLRRTPARQLLSVLPSPLLLLLSFSQACSKWHNFRFCFVVEITEIINKYARPSEHQFSSPLLASYSPPPPPSIRTQHGKFLAKIRSWFLCCTASSFVFFLSFCLSLSLSTAWQTGSIIIINYHFVGIASAVTQQQQQQHWQFQLLCSCHTHFLHDVAAGPHSHPDPGCIVSDNIYITPKYFSSLIYGQPKVTSGHNSLHMNCSCSYYITGGSVRGLISESSVKFPKDTRLSIDSITTC